MTTTKKKIDECKHDTRLMTDYLAGELSDKDKMNLEKTLETCEVCKEKFSELESAWKLTSEMLRGENIGDFVSNIEHPTSNVQHRMEEVGDQKSAKGVVPEEQSDSSGKSKKAQKSEDEAQKSASKDKSPNHKISKSLNIKGKATKKESKKANKLGAVWAKYNLGEKASDFKIMEIAASIILIFICMIFFLSKSLSTFQATEGAMDYDIECKVVEVQPEEVPEPGSGETSFFDIVDGGPSLPSLFSKKSASKAVLKRTVRRRHGGKSKDYNSPVETDLQVSMAKTNEVRGDLFGKDRVPSDAAESASADPEVIAFGAKSGSRTYASRASTTVKRDEAKRLKHTTEKLAETEDRLGQEVEKTAKLEKELQNVKRRITNLMGEDSGPAPESEKKMQKSYKKLQTLEQRISRKKAVTDYKRNAMPVKKSKPKKARESSDKSSFGFGAMFAPKLPQAKPASPKPAPTPRVAEKMKMKLDLLDVADDEDDSIEEMAQMEESVEIEEGEDEGGDALAEREMADEVDVNGLRATNGTVAVVRRGKGIKKQQIEYRKSLDRSVDGLVSETEISMDAPMEESKKEVQIKAALLKLDEKAEENTRWGWQEKQDKKPQNMANWEGKAKAPILGDLPMVGRAFRQKQAPKNIRAAEPSDYIVTQDGQKVAVNGTRKDQNGNYLIPMGVTQLKIKKEDVKYAVIKGKKEKGKKSGLTLKKIGNIFAPLSMARESARKISCVSNLKQIGLSLRMFSNVHNEEFPKPNGAAGLEEMRKEGFLENPMVYICPSTTTKTAKTGEPLTEATVSYYYVGGLTERDPSELPIVYDKKGNHQDYGNILYVDGHVKGYVLKDFYKEIAKVPVYLNKKRKELVSKTLTANLKLWDMKTAQGVADFLRKHKINVGNGSFEIKGNNVKFKLPKTEMEKVEKLFFELNETEEKMKANEQGLPFLKTKQKPISTFSIDVDTASYTRVAKEIRQGKRPATDAVRPEEFINYFDYHYRSPSSGVFGVNLEAAPSSFRPMNTVLRIGVQGKRLGAEEKRPSAFTVLIDTSGSMANKNRLELVKESMPMLLSQLRPKDQVTVISCGSDIRTVASPTSAKNKTYILNAVNRIEPMGVTNLEKGLIYAYQQAAKHYVAGGYNRVLIFTDGISNVSKASAEEILKQIGAAREKGITNTVLSVGGDGDDALLEGIADKGDGNYVFLENAASAKDLFENQFSARFREIARDVKIQVEFNPRWVREYRQVGYKNRQLAKSDFRNDTVDAGEVGAGQSVTALYELRVKRIMPLERKAQASIYPPPDTTIATVRIRYKRADNMEVEEHEFPYRLQDIMPSYGSASPSFKLASAVAEFAENLKYPDTKGIANYNTIRRALRPLLSTTYANDKKVRELDNLVRLAK